MIDGDRVITVKVVQREEIKEGKMGIDWLGLTGYHTVNQSHIERLGDIQIDEHRQRFFKYFCKIDYGAVMWRPHKFGEQTNLSMPYSKIDINPKYFESFESLLNYMLPILGLSGSVDLNTFNISRIDLKADIDNLPIDVVLARLYAMGFRRESVSIFKGSTIYIGSNPKIRIYDKYKEILFREKKGKFLTEWEKEVIRKNREITRFEIQIKNIKMTLKDVADNPAALVSHFDRFEFYNFEDDVGIAGVGGLQLLMSKIRREERKKFEQFKEDELKRLIRGDFMSTVNQWFGVGEKINADDIPF